VTARGRRRARGVTTGTTLPSDTAALTDVRDRLLEAALFLSAGEPRERVAEPLLRALDVIETLVPSADRDDGDERP